LETEKAVDLNPNDPEARRYLGFFLAAAGNPDAGIEQMDVAKQLNPFDTRWVPWIRGIGCFTARRYEEAITAFRQARDTNNELRGWLAASYAQAGRVQEAKAIWPSSRAERSGNGSPIGMAHLNTRTRRILIISSMLCAKPGCRIDGRLLC
jgi:tetratricopeptide (TPR) repeat protein